MSSFTDVFGGGTVNPTDNSYRAIALTGNTTFEWPLDNAGGTNLVARIMDVTASSGPFNFTMPDATLVSPGESVLFNTIGANSFVVKDSAGNTLLTAASGQQWFLWLKTNATAAGTWGSTQFGAATATANAAALAGKGLQANGSTLEVDSPVTSTSSSPVTIATTDRGQVKVWTGAAGTVNLPAAATATDGFYFYIRNAGSGTLTLDGSGAETINGSATLAMIPGASAMVSTNGTAWYTFGLGGAAVTSVDVSGGSTGLTTSGGPITTSGTITLAGTLAVSNGGTGATTAADARTALSAAASGANTDITSARGLDDGSVSAPAVAWSADTNTGFYRVSADVIGIAAGGVKLGRLSGAAASASLHLGYGAGAASTAANNTAVGPSAASALTSGIHNTMIGYAAGAAVTTTSGGTYIGSAAGVTATGQRNTAVGFQAGTGITSGANNTAMGYNAGAALAATDGCVCIGSEAGATATGAGNVCVGTSAGAALTTGTSNVLVGASAGAVLAGGTNCVFVGYGAGILATGNTNTAVGSGAAAALTTGTNNVMVGYAAGSAIVGAASGVFVGAGAGASATGAQNTCVGQTAGSTITSGSNLSCIGYNAEPSAATATNEITLGDTNIATIRAQVTTITAISDRRDKKNIEPLESAWNFVAQLKPSRFVWHRRDGSRIGEEDVGFIAQDLQSAQETVGFEVPHLVYGANPDRLEAGAGALMPVLVKVIQELMARVEELEAARA